MLIVTGEHGFFSEEKRHAESIRSSRWRVGSRPQNGNVALIGEIDFTQADEVTLALGFGQHPEEAAQWSTDGWRTTHDDPTRDTGLGVDVVDVPAATLAPGTTIQFTLF